ncbi:hypothetical protein SNEBB_000665 [Seison nebaliae]|nr:hypothetical protein SNEBB_000665 [Seison nebaliae]
MILLFPYLVICSSFLLGNIGRITCKSLDNLSLKELSNLHNDFILIGIICDNPQQSGYLYIQNNWNKRFRFTTKNVKGENNQLLKIVIQGDDMENFLDILGKSSDWQEEKFIIKFQKDDYLIKSLILLFGRGDDVIIYNMISHPFLTEYIGTIHHKYQKRQFDYELSILEIEQISQSPHNRTRNFGYMTLLLDLRRNMYFMSKRMRSLSFEVNRYSKSTIFLIPVQSIKNFHTIILNDIRDENIFIHINSNEMKMTKEIKIVHSSIIHELIIPIFFIYHQSHIGEKFISLKIERNYLEQFPNNFLLQFQHHHTNLVKNENYPPNFLIPILHQNGESEKNLMNIQFMILLPLLPGYNVRQYGIDRRDNVNCFSLTEFQNNYSDEILEEFCSKQSLGRVIPSNSPSDKYDSFPLIPSNKIPFPCLNIKP